ncbi:MAG: ASKHA domain-containing protein [Solirubrobacterales bacterium]
MSLIKFYGNGIEKSINVEENSTISEAMKAADISFEFPCSGMGFCGKCVVIATGALSEPDEDEKKFINIDENQRLACCARIIGDVSVTFTEGEKSIKTINSGMSLEVTLDSNIRVENLGSIIKGSSRPFAEIIDYSIKKPGVYAKLSTLEEGDVYGVLYEDEVIDVSIKKPNILGAAVDIGTTGISAYLLNLETGVIIKKLSSLNPQTKFGGDVVSRITCCQEADGEKKLKNLIVDEINRLIEKLTGETYSVHEVYNVVVAGNTTMTHLLLGINPSSMAMAPYRPVLLESCIFNGSEIGININPEGRVTILPGASAYVGADIIAGIAAIGFNNRSHKSIFIDIGTNGEIAAISNGKMICTSTAAGPALEGMNISCGCRAEKGAIESFYIDEDYIVIYSTVEGDEPVGICGSGLLDIVGSLLKRNIITSTGSFNKNMDVRIKERFVDKKFYITDKIFVSQKDIRQIQLAKGAIAAGIIMLLEKMDVSISEVEEIVIAGAFGYHINPESILEMGLIPKGFKGEITFAGNTSIEGARLAVINKNMLVLMDKIKDEMEILELSTDEGFQNYFIRELNF